MRLWVGLSAAFIAWLAFLAPTQIGGPVALGVVQGVSMEPALHTNDLVVAYRQSTYQVEDVVLYSKYGGYVIHKIVMQPREGRFITRGINNGYQDSWPVNQSDIKGKMLFAVPWVGGLFVAVGTNPLFAGFAGVVVASFVLIPSRRQKISPELMQLLQHSATERRHIKTWMSATMTLLWVLVIASLAATVLQLVRGLPLFPQVTLSLAALVIAFAVLIGFWEFNGDGRGQPEPQKSMAMLGPRLHRIPPDVIVAGANDTVIQMDTANQLRNVKDHTGLPVLHQIDIESRTHSFWIVTSPARYVWRVQASEAPVTERKPSPKKSAKKKS